MASVGHQKECGILGRSPYEDVDRSCGVTLFADDVFEKSLLELGTADECEHTVARRMGEVNSALETCGLRQNAGGAFWASCILPCSRWVLKSIKEFGLQIALGESSTECGGTRGCHTRSNGRFLAALFAEPHSRASLHFSFMTEITFDCRDAWRKAPRSHAWHGLLGRTGPT